MVYLSSVISSQSAVDSRAFLNIQAKNAIGANLYLIGKD